MKICFLAPANNYHTQKWCKWFTEHGHDVHVVSFIDAAIDNVVVHFVDSGADPESGDSQKIKYLFKARTVKKIVEDIAPDIVNVHYATSYGTVAALSGLKSYVLSVWGSDIYDFPKKSFLHKAMLKYSLRKANHLFSTSKAMAEEAAKYTTKPFEITPFGVDMDLFNPDKRTRELSDTDFVVGTVKGLSDKYGIRYILEAVAEIKKNGNMPIKLRIAGKGPQEQEYRQLADELGISDITTWLGFISQEEAAREWANMDVAVIPSTLESESFGVSAVEAQACGTAVIISDIPGLMEATYPEKTSMVVKRSDTESLKNAMIVLYKDSKKRNELGINGRKYVAEIYSMDSCFHRIETLLSESALKK